MGFRWETGKGHQVSASKVAQGTSSLWSENTSCRLFCLVEGEAEVFLVPVEGDKVISELKELVHEKGKNGVFASVDAKELMLLKVSDILESSINIVIHFLLLGRYTPRCPERRFSSTIRIQRKRGRSSRVDKLAARLLFLVGSTR